VQVGAAQVSPLPNPGFETGDLSNWRVSCYPTGSNCRTWLAEVGEDYAYTGHYGLRLFNANNYWWSNVYLRPENRFTDDSDVYSITMKLAGGARTYWSGVIVYIYDSKGYVQYRGNQNGKIFCYPNYYACNYFKLPQGVWKEYQFNFEQDYIKKYGRSPDSDRSVAIMAYQDTDYIDIYIDDVFGISIIPADIDFEPDTFNINSKGKWITAYIELPGEYDVSDIDVPTVQLDNVIYAESKPTEIGDYDNDGIPDLMLKFNRSSVQEILEVGNEVEITVTGELTDGTPFEGKDEIRVIEKS
jgi:hypothetical protein